MSVRAVVLREFGDLAPGGAALAVEERAELPGADAGGQVEVELLAADLQPLDRQIARGLLPGAGPLPLVTGVSAVGRTVGSGRTVVVLGELTGRGIHKDGLFADRFLAAPHQLAPAPSQLDPRAVAAGAVLGMHARHTLFEVARARRGQHVLVLGAAGGFGHAVVATAHSEGLKVIAAARRPERVDAPAGVPVVGLDELADLGPAVKDLTGGRGVDVIIDPLGGPVTGAAVRAGARACRHVLLGHTAGAEASIPVPTMMLNEHRLLAVNGFLIDVSDQLYYLRQALEDLVSGHHRPRIASVVDLGEATAAYAAATTGAPGRTVLVGAGFGDAGFGAADSAIEHPTLAVAPAPGRHDDHHHHGDHSHSHDGDHDHSRDHDHDHAHDHAHDHDHQH